VTDTLAVADTLAAGWLLPPAALTSFHGSDRFSWAQVSRQAHERLGTIRSLPLVRGGNRNCVGECESGPGGHDSSQQRRDRIAKGGNPDDGNNCDEDEDQRVLDHRLAVFVRMQRLGVLWTSLEGPAAVP
jgi:hypothetical protein